MRRSRELFHPAIIMPTSQPFESPAYMQPAYFYYQIIRDVCRDLGCEMVPVYTYWNGLVMERGLRHADLVQENVLYPNERGHDFFAEAIIQRLELDIDPEGKAKRRQAWIVNSFQMRDLLVLSRYPQPAL